MTATTESTLAAPSGSPGRTQVLAWIGLAARLVLGGVLLWAGAAKLPELRESVLAVQAYKLLPYDVATVVGYVLPLAEVMLGVLLILGLFTRVAGAIGALLMVAFVIGIASAWARGISIDCGCFGGGGAIAWEEAQAKYPWEIARDIGLFACGAYLAWRPRTPYALDTWLFRPAVVSDTDLIDDEETIA
jgi:uncharacterized membrane protein YphA (DoxX/SURF4 family)